MAIPPPDMPARMKNGVPTWTDEDTRQLDELLERKKAFARAVEQPLREFILEQWPFTKPVVQPNVDKVVALLMTYSLTFRDLLAPLDKRITSREDDGERFRKLLKWASMFEAETVSGLGSIPALTFLRSVTDEPMSIVSANTIRSLIDSFPE